MYTQYIIIIIIILTSNIYTNKTDTKGKERHRTAEGRRSTDRKLKYQWLETVETRESTDIYNTKCLAGIEDALVIEVVGEDKFNKKNISLQLIINYGTATDTEFIYHVTIMVYILTQWL